MNIMVVVDQNWGIGCKGNLLAHLPADLRRLKEMTLGKTVVFGDVTYYTLPARRDDPSAHALPGRRNVVLTLNPKLTLPDAEVVRSLSELGALLKDVPAQDVFILGGASVYRQLLSTCELAYVTRIDNTFSEADRFFPPLDEPDWTLLETSDPVTEGAYPFRYLTYRNNCATALTE